MTFSPGLRQTIFLTLAGSQAHGTARDGSDLDLRGVCVAPLDVRLSLFSAFEQEEGGLGTELEAEIRPRLMARATAAHGHALETECVIYDVAKFVRLCAGANPNALEILFADEADWLLETPAWRRLHDQRHRFLSKKVRQTFLGYAMAQLRKIKSHRSWLLHPPARKPSRDEFGLPAAETTLSREDENRIEQSIADKVRSYSVDDVEMPKHVRLALQERMEALVRDVLSGSDEEIAERMRAVGTHALKLPRDVVAALNAEKRYRTALKHWDSYQAWKNERNPARAELERQHGYDTKHAMHLVRLMRMGVEALEQGELRVRRTDAAELAAIRDGAMSFDDIQTLAARLQDEMERAATTTMLADDVDLQAVNAVAFELMTRAG